MKKSGKSDVREKEVSEDGEDETDHREDTACYGERIQCLVLLGL